MGYQIVCSDIDGTVLNNRNEVTDRLRKTVNIIVNELNIDFALVSARMPKAIKPIQEDLGASKMAVSYAGALVMEGKQVIYSERLPIEVVQNVCEISKELGIHISIYKENSWYVEKIDKWIQGEIDITGVQPAVTDIDILIQKWRKEGTSANKILVTSSVEKIKEVGYILSNQKGFEAQVGYSKSNYLELLPLNTNKGRAVQAICEQRKVDSSQVIAIGDESLDIPMIVYAGCGIAMGNAIDAVKEKADMITKSNDEDGVACALEFLLSQ